MNRLSIVVMAVGALLIAGPVYGYPASGTPEAVTLSPAEASALAYLREFEKYMRDRFVMAGDCWDEPLFTREALAEQTHMDALKRKLDRYGVADPVGSDEIGAFSDGFLTEGLNTMLYVCWAVPPMVYRHSARIEEMSIRDLREAIAGTDKPELIDTYTNLLAGSSRHLWVFASHLVDDVADYQAQILSQGDVDAILAAVDEQPDQVFAINAGLTDTWFDPATDGQGFFISVYPDKGMVMLAWFTYDTVLPPADAVANLGDAGQRWLTAQGPYDGARAELDVYSTSGGLFDSTTPVPVREIVGSLVLQFEDCNSGSVTYDLPDIGGFGMIPIQRLSPDNVSVCEVYAASTP